MRGLAIWGSVLLLTFAMAASALGAAQRVSITVTVLEDETFITSGNVLCPSGTAETTFEKFAGGGSAGSFHGYKTLACSDGSGSFRITFDAGTVFGSAQDQGGWHVIDGTGAYSGLRGGGSLVGTYIEGGIVDVYTGRVMLGR